MTCQERVTKSASTGQLKARALRGQFKKKKTHLLSIALQLSKKQPREKKMIRYEIAEESIHNLNAPLITRHHLLVRFAESPLIPLRYTKASFMLDCGMIFFLWIWLISLPLSLHKTHLALSLASSLALCRVYSNTYVYACKVAFVYIIHEKKDWRTN